MFAYLSRIMEGAGVWLHSGTVPMMSWPRVTVRWYHVKEWHFQEAFPLNTLLVSSFPSPTSPVFSFSKMSPSAITLLQSKVSQWSGEGGVNCWCGERPTAERNFSWFLQTDWIRGSFVIKNPTTYYTCVKHLWVLKALKGTIHFYDYHEIPSMACSW